MSGDVQLWIGDADACPDPSRLVPVRNAPHPWYKPARGTAFWTSTWDAERRASGWTDWCEGQRPEWSDPSRTSRTLLALHSERPDADLATAAYLLGRYDRRSDAEPATPGAPCRQCGGPTVRRTTRGSVDGEHEYDLCERCGWVQPVEDGDGGEREPDAWVLVDQAERLLAGVFGDTSWGRDVGLWRARVDEARALRPAAEGGS